MPDCQLLTLKNNSLSIRLRIHHWKRIQTIAQLVMTNANCLDKIWKKNGELICQWIDLHAQSILLADFELRESFDLSATPEESLLDVFLTIVAIRQLCEQLSKRSRKNNLAPHIKRMLKTPKGRSCQSDNIRNYYAGQLRYKNINLKMRQYYPPDLMACCAGYKALHQLVQLNSTQEPEIQAIVRMLCIQPDIAIWGVNDQGETALELAIKYENEIVRRELIRALAYYCDMGHVALCTLIASDKRKAFESEIKNLLLNIPDIYNRPFGSMQQTALHLAIKVQWPDLVRFMLTFFPNLDIHCYDANMKRPTDLIAEQEGEDEWNPIERYVGAIEHILFFWGSKFDTSEEAQQWVNRSEDINKRNDYGYTILHIVAVTCLQGIEKITSILCTHPDIDLLAVGNCGETPLDLAISRQNKVVAMELIRALCLAISKRCNGSVSSCVSFMDMILDAIAQGQNATNCQSFARELLKTLHPKYLKSIHPASIPSLRSIPRHIGSLFDSPAATKESASNITRIIHPASLRL